MAREITAQSRLQLKGGVAGSCLYKKKRKEKSLENKTEKSLGFGLRFAPISFCFSASVSLALSFFLCFSLCSVLFFIFLLRLRLRSLL